MSAINPFDYSSLFRQLHDLGVDDWANSLPTQIDKGLDRQRYGDIPKWHAALQNLPALQADEVQCDTASVRVSSKEKESDASRQALYNTLQAFHPWRKGPFEIFSQHIDTEWRSDWKWQRVQQAVVNLEGQLVLDVGCGNGYHCWRMAGSGAKLVVGIDPSPLFNYQYWVLQHYIQNPQVWVLPLRCEQLPALQLFDTVFSMGVLYHRRSPIDHLLELQTLLSPGGQLVLETLVVEGDENTILVPQDRYAKMANVWFLPSVALLKNWLRKLKFRDIELVDVCSTSPEEQRSTDWMRFQSLNDFLDPQDNSKTIEGYPAPRRAIIRARRS